MTMDDIRSSVPHDLTSYVTTLGDFPLASGTYGDIYKGKLCMGERSTDVRRTMPFLSNEIQTVVLGRNQGI